MKKTLILIVLAVSIVFMSCQKECACKNEYGETIKEVKTMKDCDKACDDLFVNKK